MNFRIFETSNLQNSEPFKWYKMAISQLLNPPKLIWNQWFPVLPTPSGQKSAKWGSKKRLKIGPILSQILPIFWPPDNFYCIFMWQFFWKVKNQEIFFKKVFGFIKVKIFKTFWWKLKMTKGFHLKKVKFLLYRNWQKMAKFDQIRPKIGKKQAIFRFRPKIG